MEPEATLKNPAENLAAIVSQLYELAGNSQVPAAQQRKILLQAHALRGDLVTLVAVQFSRNTAAYQSAFATLGKVTTALAQASQNITKVTKVVAGLGELTQSIDALLKEAAKMGALV